MIVLLAILCVSTFGVAQQDTLDDTKDILIDEPADKTEDVFDETEDVFDDDDNDVDNVYDQDRDHDTDCFDDDSDCDFDVDQDRDDCDLDVDDDDCDVDIEQDDDDCDLDVEESDCDVDVDQDDDDCDLDVEDDDSCDLEEVEQEEPTICEQAAATMHTTEPIAVTMSELQDNPENYYGKTVKVEGELHRIFNNRVFTIEDDGFFRDKDVLVINQSGSCNAIEACDDSFEPGKDILVTGLVVPYERGKLECAYGPLDLESREGHSFTKNPVLVISKPTATAVVIEREKPAPAPEPAPLPPPEPAPVEPEPIPEPAPEPPPELPTTAGETPLLGLIGALSLGAAFVLRRRAIAVK
jgi:hypothetical protein